MKKKDKEKIIEILKDSGLWCSMELVGEILFNQDTIEIRVGKRTDISGTDHLSTDVTTPLLKEQFVVIVVGDDYLWIKKIRPNLKWELVAE